MLKILVPTNDTPHLVLRQIPSLSHSCTNTASNKIMTEKAVRVSILQFLLSLTVCPKNNRSFHLFPSLFRVFQENSYISLMCFKIFGLRFPKFLSFFIIVILSCVAFSDYRRYVGSVFLLPATLMNSFIISIHFIIAAFFQVASHHVQREVLLLLSSSN